MRKKVVTEVGSSYLPWEGNFHISASSIPLFEGKGTAQGEKKEEPTHSLNLESCGSCQCGSHSDVLKPKYLYSFFYEECLLVLHTFLL